MGLGKRIAYSLRCFLSILLYGRIPESIALELGATTSDKPRPQEAEARAPSYDRAVQMLALLQREGRLIDFFAESQGRQDKSTRCLSGGLGVGDV